MATQVMTRRDFYQRYPSFARLAAGSAERRAWLAAHPVAARQWENTRTVEREMSTRYGEDWRTNSSASMDRWYRTVADFLDGGFSRPAASAPGTAGVPGGTPAPSAGQAAPSYDRNAYELLRGVYAAYGLESLAPKILEYAQQGYTNDTIEILLRQTDEYNKRFAANKQRVAAGKNALSITEYLRLEDEYGAILTASGLPSGFYDSRDDFTNWISGDVSPDELRERVVMAQQAAMSSDPGIRQQLAAYYNIGQGDLVAYFLDQKRATSLFETRRVFGTAAVGAAGAAQGLRVTKDRAQLFADQGVTGDQARQGFASVAAALPDAERLSSIYDGADVGQTELEDEFLGGNAMASQKRAKLAGKEAASFSGSSGVQRNSLGKRRKGRY